MTIASTQIRLPSRSRPSKSLAELRHAQKIFATARTCAEFLRFLRGTARDPRRQESQIHQRTRQRNQPVSAPARAQPRELVPVGRRSVCESEERKQAGLSLSRLQFVPLVPRDGTRVV